jgi:hypothetical protein
VERHIREAMERGDFDDLPHGGERLPADDDNAAGEWAMAHRILRNAGAAPPWIESDKEARRLLSELDALLARAPLTSKVSRARERARLARIVTAANRRSPGSTRRRQPRDSIGDRSMRRSNPNAWSGRSTRLDRRVVSRTGRRRPRRIRRCGGRRRPPSWRAT